MRSITIAVLLAGPAAPTPIAGGSEVSAGDLVTSTYRCNGPRVDASDRVNHVEVA
jgi:hypothetical protein